MSVKSLEYYLELPYTVQVKRLVEDDGDVSFFAKVTELPGCMTEADSVDEIWEMIEEAKRLWIEVALEDGAPIPEPIDSRRYSGKFVLRTPVSLHEQLATNAKCGGVSLNQYVVATLAQSIGQRAHVANSHSIKCN